jgi:hypothetical protein
LVAAEPVAAVLEPLRVVVAAQADYCTELLSWLKEQLIQSQWDWAAQRPAEQPPTAVRLHCLDLVCPSLPLAAVAEFLAGGPQVKTVDRAVAQLLAAQLVHLLADQDMVILEHLDLPNKVIQVVMV